MLHLTVMESVQAVLGFRSLVLAVKLVLSQYGRWFLNSAYFTDKKKKKNNSDCGKIQIRHFIKVLSCILI